jgi:hypothetical protein
MWGIEHMRHLAGTRSEPMNEIAFRIVTTLVIALAILFAIAAYGYFSGSWDAPVGRDLL